MSDPLDLEERLEGWATFWRWKLGLEQAASIEGQYRSPQPWDQPIPPAWLDVDEDDVQAIESAVCAMDLFHHTLLKLWYIRRRDEDTCLTTARRAAGEPKEARRRGKGEGGRIRAADSFRSSLAMAKALLLAELARPAVVRKRRASEYVRNLLGLERLTAVPMGE